MLPSYPHVLRALAEEAMAHLSRDRAVRLLCTADAVPFGVGLSLETKIPLVYSQGINDRPVRDLVGAYDIGHETVLVTNIFSGFRPLSRLIADARQVGLEAQTLLAIVDLWINGLKNA
jgi:hypothetical protein